MQARMAAADYGTARQHQLSTAVRRDQRPAATSRNMILAARDCNVAGTEAAENARANEARLQGWGSVGKLDDSDDDGKANIAGGQTHRMRIRGELRQHGDIQEPSRVSGSGDARQLQGSSRVTAAARAPVYAAPRTHPPTTPGVIERDTPDLPQLTDGEWREIKRIYDELKIPQIKPRTPEEIEAARERLYTKSKPRRLARTGPSSPPVPSTPARNHPTRAPPVNKAWAPGNLVVNPAPPLNLSNPSVTTNVEDMRRRLGSNFIEIPEQETILPHTNTTTQPVREPVYEPITKPSNPFDLPEPSIVTLEKDMQRNYGSAGIETAVVEASIASARSALVTSNSFDIPDPCTRPHKSTPASTPDDAIGPAEELASASDNDELLDLVDAKLNDFHITNKSQIIEPSTFDNPTISGEVNLMEFEEEEAPGPLDTGRADPNLLDTIPETALLPPLEPSTDDSPPLPQPTAVESGATTIEDTHTEEAGSFTAPSDITSVFTEPLPYMGSTSAFHQEVLSSSDAFWAQQKRRREQERAPAPALPARSLKVSRWAPATHTPPRNDNA
ncbi:hypothetical protein LTR70_010584 [Exophiala xenobiotica]|uniref:Uncharacterized protein n=1 Tax=Lithohypha guttulata TaxID=1690604 RepID=A0ABR0JTK2_9EURO|nr:hypothetical protein LTR24_010617 [Lithohypha guttulata]KAK5309124.1 hypothetical protein LTR70_010584 [Exophiala xenobiotica]